MDKLTKDAVFLFEVLDDGALFPVYPSRHCDDQDVPWAQMHAGNCSLQGQGCRADLCMSATSTMLTEVSLGTNSEMRRIGVSRMRMLNKGHK